MVFIIRLLSTSRSWDVIDGLESAWGVYPVGKAGGCSGVDGGGASTVCCGPITSPGVMVDIGVRGGKVAFCVSAVKEQAIMPTSASMNMKNRMRMFPDMLQIVSRYVFHDSIEY